MTIYAFNLSTGARDESMDIPVPRGDRSNLAYIWSNAETMWVLDWEFDVVHAINMSDGEPDTDKTFDALKNDGNFRANGDRVNGIWSDRTTLYVAIEAGYGLSKSNARIDAYDLGTGARDPGKDINSLWAAGNRTPHGMWSDGITLWVADAWSVYAYDLATGKRQAHLEFNAGLGYTETLSDMWSDGRTMWVSYDPTQTQYPDWLRAFDMPKTGLLYSLTLNGTDVPDVPFQTGISSYEVEVPAATTSVTVEAVPAFADSQVTILPTDSDDGTVGHQVDLAVGITEITVTSVNGGDVRTYTITVNRPS